MSPRNKPALDTGRYTITNVRYSNYLFLGDANVNSELVSTACCQGCDPGAQWNVDLLNNHLYTIQSYGHGLYANREPNPAPGESTFGGYTRQQWRVKEMQHKGHFVIFPSDAQVYLGIKNGEGITPITFEETPNDPKNQWTFTKVSEREDEVVIHEGSDVCPKKKQWWNPMSWFGKS